MMRDFDDGNNIAAIVVEYLAAGHGRSVPVGAAGSYLFDAQGLVPFGESWMEKAFGLPSDGQ